MIEHETKFCRTAYKCPNSTPINATEFVLLHCTLDNKCNTVLTHKPWALLFVQLFSHRSATSESSALYNLELFTPFCPHLHLLCLMDIVYIVMLCFLSQEPLD